MGFQHQRGNSNERGLSPIFHSLTPPDDSRRGPAISYAIGVCGCIVCDRINLHSNPPEHTRRPPLKFVLYPSARLCLHLAQFRTPAEDLTAPPWLPIKAARIVFKLVRAFVSASACPSLRRAPRLRSLRFIRPLGEMLAFSRDVDGQRLSRLQENIGNHSISRASMEQRPSLSLPEWREDSGRKFY